MRKTSEFLILNPWGSDDPLSWEEAVWIQRVWSGREAWPILPVKTTDSPVAPTRRTLPRCHATGVRDRYLVNS